ncbi:MAG: apolipoprotein N-acyltransferase, partial [Alphaproteobacteria bacterium]
WSAFAVGWWFGFGFFVAGLYWIYEAFLVNPEQFAWMIPFAVSGLSAGMALFPALASGLCWRISKPGLGRVLALAGAWTLAEGLRGWAFTGFPWNLLAYAWSSSDVVMQTAAVVGAFGVSFLTVLILAMPAVLGGPSTTFPKRGGAILVALAVAVVILVAGAARLHDAGPLSGLKTVSGVGLRLVQANIPQTLKWEPARRERQFDEQIELSRAAGFGTVTTVIWPETASVFALNVDPPHRARIAASIPPGGKLIVGAPRVTP